MRLRNIYVAANFEDQQGWDDLITRLAWYFTPYLEQIGVIHLCASPEQLAAVSPNGPYDPTIQALLPALKKKVTIVSREMLDGRLKSVDPNWHLFLLADARLEDSYRLLIDRFQSKGRFYRVDPQQVRMEGSFYLWAGVNTFTNAKEDTRAYHARFLEMAKEVGQHEKAYVFGTGPSLSDFVEGHDFSDGLTIIANSIVLNDDLLEKLKPKIIVAADPIFHAGCSSYAAAFRAALATALDKTGAWFLCPLRDVQIYRTYLPEHLQQRILGVPFDAKAPPPTDLGKTYALKAYPNILTLMLLPLASTFARSVHIAGCDGRKMTEDGSFWAHDKKAQFNDEMDNIKKIHPGFFAIDYNNYYFDHARDLEEVLLALEDAGRRVVNECRSFIPALNLRERGGLRDVSEAGDRRFEPRMLAILDPDARGEWGHFLAYDRRLGQAVADQGLGFSIIGRTDLAPAAKPEVAQALINVFSRHSWVIGNKWPETETGDLSAFALEIDEALVQLEQETPYGDILLFMYCGSLEVVDLLEHVLISHPRVRAVINLFWSYNFDISNPAYQARWHPLLARVLRRPGRVRVTHSTPQIAAEFEQAWGLDIPVLPHPSTTFGDSDARMLATRPARALSADMPPRILFPGGARYEKGYMLAVDTCADLSQTGEFELCLRARLDAADGKMRAAVAALDPARVTLESEDFSESGFVGWLGSADVIVVPYLPVAFSNRTSGMLVDAMLLGVPIVVVRETWLADEVAQSGAGVAVDPTPEALMRGIRTVLEQYPHYAEATRIAAAQYLQSSTWARLTDRLQQVSGVACEDDAAPEFSCFMFREDGQEPDGPQALAHLQALAQELDSGVGKDMRGLITYDDPAAVLAQVLAEKGDPAAALAAWEEQAAAALALFRRARRQLSIIERSRMAAAPAPYRSMLEDLLPGPRLPALLRRKTAMADPLLLAVAGLHLDQSPVAQRHLAELRACGLRPDGVSGQAPLDLSAVLGAYHALAGQRMKAEDKTELDSLRLQARASVVDLEQANEREQARRREANLLSEQLVQMQVTVETYFNEAEALRGDLDRVYRSKSWRVTEPLRGLSRVVRPGHVPK